MRAGVQLNQFRKFELNKLVRDRFVEELLLQGQGSQASYRFLNSKQLIEAFFTKLCQAKAEFYEQPDIGKLVDVKEIIEEAEIVHHRRGIEIPENLSAEIVEVRANFDGLLQAAGVTIDELEIHQSEKRSQKGGFSTHTYLKTVTLPSQSQWAKYFASRPDRFPEILEETQH